MAAYAVSIFTGAFLLFQVQPLMGKYLLPWFGGATGVWTTCMLFFQVLLLAGYAYAHLSSRLLRPRGQLFLHLGLIVIAAATLPITPDDSWKPLQAGDPVLRIIALLAVSLGIPYFVLSATAPLLQHWFSRTHQGTSPFRLYALSNAGSLLALLSYPALFEVTLTRQQQATFWAAGFLVYGTACAWVGRLVWRTAQTTGKRHAKVDRTPAPAARDRTFWLLLPACASVLLLAITNKICQDVAVIPFLWVLPLSLYLLSFIICFEKPSWYDRRWSIPVFTVALLVSWYLLGSTNEPSVAFQLGAYSMVLLVSCLVAHGEVFRLRPHPEYLTGFYLLISAGGALGGVFVALIAPLLFANYYELHAGLIGCGALFLAVLWKEQQGTGRMWVRPALGFGVALLATMSFTWWQQARKQTPETVFRSRNFYGVLNIQKKDAGDPATARLELVHGRVLHGLQFTDPSRAGRPTLYYVPESGIGRALSLFPSGQRKIGIVGQGAGTLAAYGQAGDVFRFYEINPDVDRAARSPFTFMSNSAAKTEVILGDARLSLEAEPDQNYDLLALDAFSSDAIPVHLLTREAFKVYQRHLKPSGMIAVHISNMSLDLEAIVLSAGREFGYTDFTIEYQGADSWNPRSIWVLLTREASLANHSILRRCIRPSSPAAVKTEPWSDDFAALFPLLRWNEFLGRGSTRAQNLTREALELEARLDLSGAAAAYRKALECQPHFTVPLNNLAWLLATATDANLRNGQEAVKRAELACTISGYRVIGFIGTLAAAYAEAGRFQDAIAAAEEACDLAKAAGEQELLHRNEQLLTLYRERRPFRERR